MPRRRKLTRADKLLARSGLYTRSEARGLIRAGRVTIGGRAVSKPEDKFPDGAAVLVDGSEVNCEEFRYFMLSKPAGILSATDDSRARTVLDLFPPELRRLGIAPVGRLDKDTTGPAAAHERRGLRPPGHLAEVGRGEALSRPYGRPDGP